MAIKVKPDKDGRIFINLYGQKIVELDKKDFDDKGCATIKRFGETYEIKVAALAKKKEKSQKVARPESEEEPSSEIDFEEMPIEE